MSRTFEVLERLQQDRNLFRVPRVLKTTPPIGPIEGSAGFPDLGAFAREEVHKLVQCLFLAQNSDGSDRPRRVVFCGVDEGDGSNLLCVRVAGSLSEQAGSQVCVVDGNVRGTTKAPLSAWFADANFSPSEWKSPQNSLHRVATNLCLLTGHSITANGGSGTLNQLQERMKELSSEFMYWVIAAAPIALSRDATILGQVADGVVLVVEANSTRREAARKAKETLERAKVPLLGVVLNNRKFPIPQSIYSRL